MNRLTFLGFLFLTLGNSVSADEYIMDDYFEEVSSLSHSNVVYEQDEFLPITKTIEDEEREKAKAQSEVINVETITIAEPVVIEEQPIEALTYESVLEQAKREDKIIILMIRSTNCKYCDIMEAGTLSDKSVKDALAANFVSIHYNQDEEPLPLGLQNGATPMFIFVNKNGDILNQYPGMRNPDQFKEALRQILAK